MGHCIEKLAQNDNGDDINDVDDDDGGGGDADRYCCVGITQLKGKVPSGPNPAKEGVIKWTPPRAL